MVKTIGVKPTIIIDYNYLGELKQHYLLFDTIGIPMLSNQFNINIERGVPKTINAELEYLLDQKIVQGISEKASYQFKDGFDIDKYRPLFDFFLQILKKDLHPLILTELYARFSCFEIFASKEYFDVSAYPISIFPDIEVKSIAKKTDIIQIILGKIPVPDGSTPWEDIIEFKNDKQSILKMQALKVWMTDISKGNYTINEVKEKTDYLLNTYSECLRLHKIKTNTGILKMLIVGGATLIENIAKFRLEKIAELPFLVKERKADLLLTEIQAPGSELAYIYSSSKKFAK